MSRQATAACLTERSSEAASYRPWSKPSSLSEYRSGPDPIWARLRSAGTPLLYRRAPARLVGRSRAPCANARCGTNPPVQRQAAGHRRRHRRSRGVGDARRHHRRPRRLGPLLRHVPVQRLAGRGAFCGGLPMHVPDQSAQAGRGLGRRHVLPWRGHRAGHRHLAVLPQAQAEPLRDRRSGRQRGAYRHSSSARIANFVNGELWGRATDVPWAMVFCNDTWRDYGHCRPEHAAPSKPAL